MLVGIGLTLYLTNDHQMVQRVGTTLCLIALLWRVLLYLRDTAPAWEHLKALGEPKLSILEPPAFEQVTDTLQTTPAPARVPGSSPVQRLIHDESEH